VVALDAANGDDGVGTLLQGLCHEELQLAHLGEEEGEREGEDGPGAMGVRQGVTWCVVCGGNGGGWIG
jgi:hypothetical protein